MADTESKFHIERLERMLSGPDAANTAPARSENFALLKNLIAMAFATAVVYTYFNQNNYTLFMCGWMLVVLVAINLTFPAERKALDKKDKLTLLGAGSVCTLLAGLAALSAMTPKAAAPPSTQPTSPAAIGPTLDLSPQNIMVPQNNTVDPYLAQKIVGAVTPGMSITKSQITGHVDANSLTSAMYWTMVFSNKTSEQREARARIALPKGATVFRLTSWINGIPEEAAFNSTERVQSAYTWVVRGRREPVLVTENKNGEIFLQAYPVPAGGVMQIRFGITAPLDPTSKRDFELMPPRVVESNLETNAPSTLLKLESNATISGTGLDQATVTDNSSVLTGNLDTKKLQDYAFKIHRSSDFTGFAARATHSAEKSFIVERLEEQAGGYKIMRVKSSSSPTGYVAFDFPTASRVSTLWAADEARKLVRAGESETAVSLGTTYRVVTPVTGAVVLESQSDYDRNGLKRDFYSVGSKGEVPGSYSSGRPRRSAAPKGALLASARRASAGEEAFSSETSNGASTAAPLVQGATNGTLGPDFSVDYAGAKKSGVDADKSYSPDPDDAFARSSNSIADVNYINGSQQPANVTVDMAFLKPRDANLNSGEPGFNVNLTELAAPVGKVLAAIAIAAGAFLIASMPRKSVSRPQRFNKLLIGSSFVLAGLFAPAAVTKLLEMAMRAGLF